MSGGGQCHCINTGCSSASLAPPAARRSPARLIQGATCGIETTLTGHLHPRRAHVSKRPRMKWKRPCLHDFWEINLRQARALRPSSVLHPAVRK